MDTVALEFQGGGASHQPTAVQQLGNQVVSLSNDRISGHPILLAMLLRKMMINYKSSMLIYIFGQPFVRMTNKLLVQDCCRGCRRGRVLGRVLGRVVGSVLGSVRGW